MTAASSPVGTANTPSTTVRSMLSISTDSRFGRLFGCKEKVEDYPLLALHAGGLRDMSGNDIHQSGRQAIVRL